LRYYWQKGPPCGGGSSFRPSQTFLFFDPQCLEQDISQHRESKNQDGESDAEKEFLAKDDA